MYCVELALKGLASAGKGAAVCVREVMERPWVGVYYIIDIYFVIIILLYLHSQLIYIFVFFFILLS